MSEKKFPLALVTGASSGIGHALCRLLADKDIPLIITGRDTGRLHAVAKEIEGKVPVTVLTADLATAAGRKVVADEIRARSPELVINNAGFGLYGEGIKLSLSEQLQMVDVDVKGVMELTVVAAETLRERGKGGTILNVSSAASFLVFPLFATYAASKAFVTSYSQSMDFELAPHGIRVLVSCPGVIATAFRQRAGGITTSKDAPMTVDYAAAQIWRQIEKNQRVRIFDLKTRLGIALSKLLPTKFVARLLSRAIESFT